MPVRLQPTSTIIANLGCDPTGRVQKFFQNTCYKRMDKYVPKDIGNLRTNVDLSNPTKIVYESPYALAQYYGIVNGKPVQNYTTDGTGPYWDKRMWTAEGQDVVREMQNYIRRRK